MVKGGVEISWKFYANMENTDNKVNPVFKVFPSAVFWAVNTLNLDAKKGGSLYKYSVRGGLLCLAIIANVLFWVKSNVSFTTRGASLQVVFTKNRLELIIESTFLTWLK